jgi:hypothetical protein
MPFHESGADYVDGSARVEENSTIPSLNLALKEHGEFAN